MKIFLLIYLNLFDIKINQKKYVIKIINYERNMQNYL